MSERYYAMNGNMLGRKPEPPRNGWIIPVCAVLMLGTALGFILYFG